MPSITIDGEAKIIDIGYDAPSTVVTASAIYSEWKRWVQTGEANWDEAFAESVGGNDLGGGSALDAYYFLRNDLGWRIRAADQDHELVIDGQLFGFSSGIAVYLSRPGRTITYRFVLSSRSQVVDQEADIPSVAQGYQGAVYLDPSSPSGGSTYPTGTSVQPVNNWASAVIIANTYGIRTIRLLGTLALTTDNISGFTVEGLGGPLVSVSSAANVTDTSFVGVDLTGDLTGCKSVSLATVTGMITNFDGDMVEVILAGSVELVGDAIFSNCASGVAGNGQPYIDCANAGTHSLQVREWTGGIELRNFSAGSVASFDFHSGKLIVNANSTGGFAKVRGVGEPIENNGAVTLDEDGFINAAKIINPVAANIWAAN